MVTCCSFSVRSGPGWEMTMSETMKRPSTSLPKPTNPCGLNSTVILPSCWGPKLHAGMMLTGKRVSMETYFQRPSTGSSTRCVSAPIRSFPVAKIDEVDVSTVPVLSGLEQIHDTLETGAACELRSDISERHGADRVDLDVPRMQLVTAADLHVRACPDAHAAGDLPLPNGVTQMFRKDHTGRSLSASFAPTLLKGV